MVVLENELEKQRMQVGLSQEETRRVYRLLDKERKGYLKVEDYSKFFKEHYHGNVPFSYDDICYLFRRHDRYRQGKVL